MHEPCMCEAVLALTGKQPADVKLIYLGTAAYDLPAPMHRPISLFAEAGCACSITELHCACGDPVYLQSIFSDPDVVLVSGGKPLPLAAYTALPHC